MDNSSTLSPVDKVNLLWDRFVHRTDSYTEQWYDPNKGGGYGRVKIGKCQHQPACKECKDVQYIALNKDDIVSHLRGDKTIGAYAINTDDTVKWLCLDMDIRKGNAGDVQALTLDVARFMAKYFPKDSWKVEFSGNRGYHVWLFFAEPIKAFSAHAIGTWIRNNITVPPELGIEIYPKQLSAIRTGNPVKIPLGIHKKTGNRCFFVRGDFTEHEDQWKVLQSIVPMSKLDVELLIDTHNIYQVDTMPSVNSNPRRDMPCMTRIMEEGLNEGARDVGFFRLALFLKDRGIPYGSALAVLEETNRLCEPRFEAVEEKAQSAYQNDYSVFPCFDPTFDEYCSSGCAFYAKKKKDRGYNKEEIIKKLSRD